jgi:hypothetical protein
MKTGCFSETMVPTCKSRWHQNPKECQPYHCGNLKSHIWQKCLLLSQNNVRKLSTARFCIPFSLYFYALYSLVQDWESVTKTCIMTELSDIFVARTALQKFQMHNPTYLSYFNSKTCILLLNIMSLKQIQMNNCLPYHLDQNNLTKDSFVWFHVPFLLWFCS